MINFEFAKNDMIKKQLYNRGIGDPKVLDAFKKIDRHLFIGDDIIDQSYDDNALPIGHGQTISQPYITALMTELLNPGNDEVILEIGTGSGFQTAILSTMAKFVVSVEKIRELSVLAKQNIAKLNIENIETFVADGTLGWKDNAPYDGIIVTAGSPEIPKLLLDQLKPGGRMIIPLGREAFHVLTLVLKTEDGFTKEEIMDCTFVPLIGRGFAE
ncbi:MAG: protein-L-isoaspartate(D-aspartate) O-methyltransferase [Candidatus Delongbacteria bacterium]|jgi:protein-L-isoaspartate(D-aspartate) O-methyltransferase|nr:protein-L-isoaspartate(D-aspartate) O-methyltransferase [Candidatus Delongbacteria bacterium]